MTNNIKIGVIGGDLRQLVAAMELAEEGYETAVFGFDSYEGSLGMITRCVAVEDAVRDSSVVVLPLPYSIDKLHLNTPLSQNEIHLDYLFSLFDENQLIIGGKFDLLAESFALKKSLKLIDYYKREDLAILNAIPTAEGAINIAMQELPVTLSGSKVLIVGYGRIGKILAHKLYGFHADVYISARKHEDFAWINAFGYKGVEYTELDNIIDEFDVIFNTVPVLILNKARLQKLKPEVVIVDLASNPGGVDFSSAKNLNLNVIWALSLPGKYAPISTGKIFAKIIKIIMQNEEVT